MEPVFMKKAQGPMTCTDYIRSSGRLLDWRCTALKQALLLSPWAGATPCGGFLGGGGVCVCPLQPVLLLGVESANTASSIPTPMLSYVV